jgi:hypothetical protein
MVGGGWRTISPHSPPPMSAEESRDRHIMRKWAWLSTRAMAQAEAGAYQSTEPAKGRSRTVHAANATMVSPLGIPKPAWRGPIGEARNTYSPALGPGRSVARAFEASLSAHSRLGQAWEGVPSAGSSSCCCCGGCRSPRKGRRAGTWDQPTAPALVVDGWEIEVGEAQRSAAGGGDQRGRCEPVSGSGDGALRWRTP